MNPLARPAALAALALLAACSADPGSEPTPDRTPPTVPQNLSAVSPLPSRVVASWGGSNDAASGMGGYQVFRDGALVGTVTAASTTFQDDGLTPSTPYVYTVKAFDAATPPNVSASSAPANVTTLAPPDLTPPSIPSGVTAQATSPTRVLVAWTASTDTGGAGLAGYEVLRDDVLVATLGPTAVSYEDLTVQPSTAYAYRVRAFDAALPRNASADSSPANVTTPALPDTTPPSVPLDVVAVAASHQRVNLTWSPSTDTGGAGLAGYEIRRNNALLVAVGPGAVSYADADVSPSTSYTYTVRAFDAASPANVSADSLATNVTTPAAPDLTAPTVPQAVLAQASSPTRVLVTWTASTDAGGAGLDGYEVWRDGALRATLGPTAVSYEDLTVQPSTAYTYRVRAFDAALPRNVSADSLPASVTTPAVPDTTPPTVPQNVAATSSAFDRALVTWTASTDAGGAGLAGYEVLRGALVVATLGPAATSYLDTGLTELTTYAYVVRAFDGATPPNASADSSPPASVTTPAAPDTTAPSVPLNVVATALSPTRVVVSWSASTDASGVASYDVRRDGVVVGSVSAPAASYQDDGVVASTSYAYAVRAVDASPAANASAFSSPPASATTPAATAAFGLDTRPSNTTCLAPARPTPSNGVDRSDVYPNLPSFTSPVKALQAPGDPSRWFVVEQGGRVWVFSATPGVSTRTIFADLGARVVSGGEEGLLGMAFHPSWPIVPEVYLLYTALAPRRTVISRFKSANGGVSIDYSAAAEEVILTVDQPNDTHKAGDLAFGPDGHLYAGLGDGGGEYDTYGVGQNLGSLLAKILRIDVSAGGPDYAIPADNPWAANPRCPSAGRSGAVPCPEIWAFGFRNPWRWSFDRATGDLWAGDVGEQSWEEVDVVEKGKNYGWPVREGRHCGRDYPGCPAPGTVLNGGLLTDPVTEFGHVQAAPYAVTGGYVYRGAAIPSLAGKYLFADYGSGDVFVHEPGVPNSMTLLFAAGVVTASFAEDAAGELWLVDFGGGRLYRLEPTGAGVDTVPSDLAVACPSAVNPDGPGSVLVPYALEAPFWSDGAVKQRWLALPNGTQATVGPTNDLDFPIGTVLVKQFRLGGKKIETRLLMRHTDGSWAGYSYEWNDAETAATKVVGGKAKAIGQQTWAYPSEQQCLQCHTAAAGRSLGLELPQQNGNLTYPSTGRTANQLATLEHIGILTLPAPPANLPAYPSPFGPAPLEQRARAYLHSNCSHCHQPGGPTPVTLDFRYGTSLAGTGACGTNPSLGNLGLANAKLIAPGAPGSSVVLERMKRLDSHRMPPIGRLVVDQQGVQVVTDWIQGLTGCP